MHDDQVSIDLSTARSLIGSQFPQLVNESVRHLPADGTVNTIFRIGDRLAARFPIQGIDTDELAESLRGEAAAMNELSGQSPVPTPTCVGLGRPGGGYPLPWTIQTWIPGSVATPWGVSGSVRFADDLVRLIHALRKTDSRGRSFGGGGRGGDLPDHDDWMEHCFEKSEGLLDVARLRLMWASFRELPAGTDDVMSHGDLIPANLLVDGERLVGVLDGGGFAPADPALDLVAGWHLLGDQARSVVRDGLGSSDCEWHRGAA